ncbi:MAG TPA: SIMPL domain-containing protein [Chthoniobacteraceae bacterium]|jgi:hypothetical protein
MKAFLVLPFLLSLAPLAEAQVAKPARTISVTGTAVTRTAPDLVVWSIALVDHDRDLAAAKAANDKKLAKLFAVRNELQIEAADLEAGAVNIQREYERDDRGTRGAFKHFAVTRSVVIRQREMKRFDEFLSKLVASAEMEVSVGFQSSRIHEVRATTRLQALKLAKEKAAEMAAVLEAKLGKVLTIDEHPPEGATDFSTRSMSNSVVAFDPAGGGLADVASGTFAPGAIETRVVVYTTFELEE